MKAIDQGRPSACLAVFPRPERAADQKLISVVSGCYNEEGNVRACYEQVKAVFREIGRYRYEHIFIDNASRDGRPASFAKWRPRTRTSK